MHLKNFSLIKSGHGYELAPAYDLVSTALVVEGDDEELLGDAVGRGDVDGREEGAEAEPKNVAVEGDRDGEWTLAKGKPSLGEVWSHGEEESLPEGLEQNTGHNCVRQQYPR